MQKMKNSLGVFRGDSERYLQWIYIYIYIYIILYITYIAHIFNNGQNNNDINNKNFVWQVIKQNWGEPEGGKTGTILAITFSIFQKVDQDKEYFMWRKRSKLEKSRHNTFFVWDLRMDDRNHFKSVNLNFVIFWLK